MSYSEENGQVVLRMSRKDYDKLMFRIGERSWEIQWHFLKTRKGSVKTGQLPYSGEAELSTRPGLDKSLAAVPPDTEGTPRRDEASPTAISAELKASRTAWLEQHGVPISIEFARLAFAIGAATDYLDRLNSGNPNYTPVEEKK